MSEPRDCGGDAAAYALGALEDDEAREFRTHLDRCADCRDEVGVLQAVADELPLSAPQLELPGGLKRRVMSEVRADARRNRPRAPVGSPARRAGWAFPRPALGVASIALAAVLVFGVVALVGTGTGHRTITATVAWRPGSATLHVGSGHPELVVRHMPQPPAGKVYEVWLQRASGAPSPTSVLFDVNSAGSAAVEVPEDIHGVKLVMVTAEPAGGSTVPTQKPVIVARLT